MEDSQVDHENSIISDASGVRRLDVLTAQRISKEIKDNIESIRTKFLSKRKNHSKIEYKNVSAMVSYNSQVSEESLNIPVIERAQ